MKIYKVSLDANNVNILAPTDVSKIDLDFLTFNGNEKLKNWEETEVYIQNPKTKSKHFYGMTSGVLICNADAFKILETQFEIAGEVLPLKQERDSQKLYLINILEYLNCLNYNMTEWDIYNDGTKGRILKYSFIKERIGSESSLFKIPETGKVDIFTVSGIKDENDEFYSLYHKYKLTGLKFELIQQW